MWVFFSSNSHQLSPPGEEGGGGFTYFLPSVLELKIMSSWKEVIYLLSNFSSRVKKCQKSKIPFVQGVAVC